MLESLQLTNFQSHLKLTISLDPRLTVVVGPSDVGKSAIIRALVWVLHNRPNGDEFIHHGQERAQVELRVDGHTVSRARGKAENRYTLDGEELKAFKTDVPDDVRALLQVGEVNVQCQHDAPFWFSDGGGSVSRQLNAIVNLGVIDSSLAHIASVLRDCRTRAQICEERLASAKQEVERTQDALIMDEDLQEVESAQKSRKESAYRFATMQDLVARVREHARVRRTAYQRLAEGEALRPLADQALASAGSCNRLQGLIVRLGSLQQAARAPVPDFTPLSQTNEARKQAHEKHLCLAERIETLRGLWTTARNTKKDFDAAHRQFHERTKGQACPACGQQL